MSPIPMCENGHSVCKTCRQNLLNCPVCREQFSNMRCFLLENMTRKMRHPCKYYDRGCPKAFYLQRSEKHEDQCQHQPFKCPFQVTVRWAAPGRAASLISDSTWRISTWDQATNQMQLGVFTDNFCVMKLNVKWNCANQYSQWAKVSFCYLEP